MHRVLSISEVLLEIFSYLYRKPWTVLARTCKTFYEPAMDLIWSEMGSFDRQIEPLLCCVPRFHSRRAYFRATQPCVSAGLWHQDIEPMFGHEVHHFLRHAARVRKLGVTCEHFHLLTVLSTEKCIFPRLLSLSFRDPFPRTSRYVQLFLSPLLRHCNLPAFHPYLTVMKSLGTRCAMLENLFMGPFTYEDSDSDSEDELDELEEEQSIMVSEGVRSCQRLAKLRCPPLDSAAWNHLSNLPTLCKVKISQRRTIRCPLDSDNIHLTPFLNLTSLVFDFVTPADVISLLEHGEFPSLKKFKAYFDPLPLEEAEQLCRALTQCKASDTLEEIFIESDPTPRNSGDSTAIRLFLCFKQLRFLNLSLRRPVALDNDLLLEAMSCWPRMQCLRLLDSHDHPPAVTFRGLSAALRLCPDLRAITLYMDALNIDVDPAADVSFRHPSLTSIRVGTYPRSRYLPENHSSGHMKVEVIARIIFKMFPCIQKVYSDGDGGQLEKHRWARVDHCIQSFRSSAGLDRAITKADQESCN